MLDRLHCQVGPDARYLAVQNDEIGTAFAVSQNGDTIGLVWKDGGLAFRWRAAVQDGVSSPRYRSRKLAVAWLLRSLARPDTLVSP